MEGIRTLAPILLLAVALTACDRTQTTPDEQPDADRAPAPPTVAVEGVEFGKLVERAQTLRDREFPEPPGISPVEEPYVRAVPDAVRADRDAILFGLFGRTEPWNERPTPEQQIAWWDGAEGVVRYRKGTEADAEAKERAIMVALVRGLDSIHGTAPSAPTSWDAYLASEAVRMGPAYFATAVHLAQSKREAVTAADVARHPAVVVDLPIVDAMFATDGSLEDREATFAPREGHALAAAMYRASGWSGVEMLWHDRPESTAWVVRPDRFLGGEGVGDWEWSRIPTKIRQDAGWKVEREGRIGPAISALFLSTAVDPNRARTVYLNWQSDAYRAWRRDDDWIFEWVSMWSTPTAAESFVAVAEKALGSQGRDGRFTVLRRGPIVAILGSNDDKANIDRHATSVVTMRPTFTPRDKGMIAFVPTPADAAGLALEQADLGDNHWSDPVTGLSVEVTPFSGWDIRRANELELRWFAKKDGAIVEFSTELPDPLAPDLTEDAWRDWVVEGFRKSTGELEVVAAERAEIAGRPGWEFVFDATIDGKPTRILLQQFMSEPDTASKSPRLVTYSLQVPPDRYETARAVFDRAAVEVTTPGQPIPASTDAGTPVDE